MPKVASRQLVLCFSYIQDQSRPTQKIQSPYMYVIRACPIKYTCPHCIFMVCAVVHFTVYYIRPIDKPNVCHIWKSKIGLLVIVMIPANPMKTICNIIKSFTDTLTHDTTNIVFHCNSKEDLAMD